MRSRGVAKVLAATVGFCVPLLMACDDEPGPEPRPSAAPSVSSTSPTPADAEAEGLRANEPLRMDGIGAVSVGKSVDEVEEATGEKIRVFSDFSPRCRYSQPRDGTPRGLLFMLSRRHVVRIDVDPPSKIRTAAGIGIGDAQVKVLRAYGDEMQVEGHPYLMDRGSYLVHQPEGEEDLMLIFETERGKVTSFRSGYTEQVRYIEGCA